MWRVWPAGVQVVSCLGMGWSQWDPTDPRLPSSVQIDPVNTVVNQKLPKDHDLKEIRRSLQPVTGVPQLVISLVMH